eukprot:412320-Prymnesium_polylepis.1
MSHLMYAEMRKKERRIAELERALEQATAAGAESGGGTAAASAPSAARPGSREKQMPHAHYDQLQQMQESCAKKLEGMSALEKRVAAAEAEAKTLRASVVDAGKALSDEKRQRLAEANAALAAADAAAAQIAGLDERC